MKRTNVALAAIGALLAVTRASADSPKQVWVLHEPAGVVWRPADTLPPGAMISVLEGDPSKAALFTMRLKMPDGYRVPPHWHSQQERVTVLSGVLNLGSGDTFDANATRALVAGTYSSMPPGMKHFGWMRGETVLQLSSEGPWTITYVNPADDPRQPPVH